MGVRLVKYNRTAEGNENSYYNDHDYLVNRDLANQHPIYAISGLQEVLNVLEENIKEDGELILTFFIVISIKYILSSQLILCFFIFIIYNWFGRF